MPLGTDGRRIGRAETEKSNKREVEERGEERASWWRRRRGTRWVSFGS